MDYSIILNKSTHYEEINFDLNKVLQKVEPQLVNILLKSKSEGILADSELLPCWIDKNEYRAMYEQYCEINDEKILDFVQSISFMGTNFDCNFGTEENYFVVCMDVPWESGYDGGTSLVMLFKGDSIVYACDHFDKLARNEESIQEYDEDNILTSI